MDKYNHKKRSYQLSVWETGEQLEAGNSCEERGVRRRGSNIIVFQLKTFLKEKNG